MKGLKGKVSWQSEKVRLAIMNIYLFCFEEKCMSGRIIELKELDISIFEIAVVFIEPDFFKKEIFIGNEFTIREASRILGVGKISEVI